MYTPAGTFYTWWRGDALPPLTSLPGLLTAPAAGTSMLNALTIGMGTTSWHLHAYQENGHHPYAATLDRNFAAYGWVATQSAEIGEIGLSFTLPKGNWYLWGFETLEEWRGRGIYPHLLQGILREAPEAINRFWIGHESENTASARGIVAAGFQSVGDFFIDGDGKLFVVPTGPRKRTEAAASILGVPIRER